MDRGELSSVAKDGPGLDISVCNLIDELQDDGLYSDGRTAVVVPVMMN